MPKDEKPIKFTKAAVKAKTEELRLAKEQEIVEQRIAAAAKEKLEREKEYAEYQRTALALQGVSFEAYKKSKKDAIALEKEQHTEAERMNKAYDDFNDYQAQAIQKYKEAKHNQEDVFGVQKNIADLAVQQVQDLKELAMEGAGQESTARRIQGITDQIVAGEMTQNDLASLRSQLNEEIATGKVWENGVERELSESEIDRLKNLQGIVGAQQKANTAAKLSEEAWAGAEEITGGMIGKIWEMRNPIIAATAALLQFNATQEAIGKQFGAMGVTQMRGDLVKAQVAFQGMGYSADEAFQTIADLNSQFGISLDEATDMAKTVGDISKSLGISLSDGTQLVGMFTTMGGLTEEAAENLIKSTAALAQANGVAPQAVLADVAKSTQTFAKFGKDGGENIMRAAIQARKLGIELDTVAGISESLLDFQGSLAKEMEASMLIGRDINLQKARELSLAGDLEGLQKEILDIVGSEEEFNKMNVLQRQALADAVGMQVDELGKVIAAQGEEADLQGELAKQDISDLIPESVLTNTEQLMNQLMQVGIVMAEVLGPPLNMIVGAIGGFLGFIQETVGIMPVLIGLMVGYATYVTAAAIAQAGGVAAAVASAVAWVWSGIAAMIAATAGFGTPVALALGAGAVAMILASVASSKSVGDAVIPADGKPVVSPAGSPNALVGRKDDDILMAPGIASAAGSARGGTGGGGAAAQKNTEETAGLRKDLANYFGTGGTVAKQIGTRVGDKMFA